MLYTNEISRLSRDSLTTPTIHTHSTNEGRILTLLRKAGEEKMPQEIVERLQWLLHYAGCGSASDTCAHFNISRSTFYRWLHRFDPENLQSLTDHPTRPAEENVRPSEPPLSPTTHCPFCRLRQRMPHPTLRPIVSLVLLVFMLTILLVVLPAAAGVFAYRYSNPLANISEAFQLTDK